MPQQETSGQKSEEQALWWLRERFFNLMKENKKLKQNRRMIAEQIDNFRRKERQEIAGINQKMYQISRAMEANAKELEYYKQVNAQREQEFL